MTVRTDLALLDEWRGGDAEAFRLLVERHGAMVYNAALRVLNDGVEAQDVAQDAFLEMARAGHNLPRRSVAGWLHRVATRRAIDRVRAESRRRKREEASPAMDAVEHDPAWAEIREHVDAAVAELPEHLRAAVVAHFFEGRTHADLADELGVSRPAVTKRIQRGLERLRRGLDKRGVTLGTGALGAALASAPSQALPAALTAELGKLAIAGAGTAVTAAGLFAGWTTAKTWVVASVTAAVVVAGGALLVLPQPQPNGPTADPALPEQTLTNRAPDRASTTAQDDEQSPAPDPAAIALSEPSQTGEGQWDMGAEGGGTIRGRVEGPPGVSTGGANVMMRIGRYGDPVAFHSFRAGSDGTFLITSIPAGQEFGLQASIGDGVPPAYSSSEPFEGWLARAIFPRTVRRSDNVDVVLHIEPTTAIAGRVTTPSGRPAVLVRVKAYTAEGLRDECKTWLDGRFVFSTGNPGSYVITAGQGTDGEPNRAEIELQKGEVHGDLAFVVPETYGDYVAGRVVDNDGQPVSQFRVTSPSLAMSADWTSGSHTLRAFGRPDVPLPGQFVLPLRERGEVQLEVTGDEILDHTVTVTAPDTGVSIVVQEARPISGRVVVAATGEPWKMASAKLGDLLYIETREKGFLRSSWQRLGFSVGETGEFGIIVKMTGDLEVDVTGRGYKSDPVTLRNFSPERGASGLVFEMRPTRPVHGVVLDPSGRPVADARIEGATPFDFRAGRESATLATSDTSGRFSFGPPPDLRHFRVRAVGYPPAVEPIPDSDTRSRGITVRLERGGAIEGVLVSGGAPLPDADVEIRWNAPHERRSEPAPQEELHLQTDDAGRFRADQLPAGDYDVSARASSETSFERSSSVSVEAGRATSVTVDVPGGTASLAGAVTLAGAPIPASVNVRPGGPEGHATRLATRSVEAGPVDGRFHVEGIPAGPVELKVTVRADETVRRTRTVAVTLAPGETTSIDVDFAAGAAELELVAEDSAALTYDVQRVYVDYGEEWVLLTRMGGTSDSRRIPGLPPGRATVRARYIQRTPQSTADGLGPNAHGGTQSGTFVFEAVLAANQVTRVTIAPGPAELEVTVDNPPSSDTFFGSSSLLLPPGVYDAAGPIENMQDAKRLLDSQQTGPFHGARSSRESITIRGVEPGEWDLIVGVMVDPGAARSEEETPFPHTRKRVTLVEGMNEVHVRLP